MTKTLTPRVGVPQWSDKLDLVGRADFNTAFLNIENRVATDYQGARAARPAAEFRGRYYFAQDTGVLYRDTGSTWDVVGSNVEGHFSVAPNVSSRAGTFKGLTNQSSDIVRVLAGDDTPLSVFTRHGALKSGGVYIAGNSNESVTERLGGSVFSATSLGTTQPAGVFKGFTGQTGHILQVRNSSDSVMSYFSATGDLNVPRAFASGDITPSSTREFTTSGYVSNVFLAKNDAASTYATIASLQNVQNNYLTTADATSTYLTKSVAQSTYATLGHTHASLSATNTDLTISEAAGITFRTAATPRFVVNALGEITTGTIAYSKIKNAPQSFEPGTHVHDATEIASGNLDWARMPLIGVLAADANLSDRTTPGMWYQPSNAEASTAKSYPVNSEGGLLEVMVQGTSIVQTYTSHVTAGGYYWRSRVSGAWTPWKQASVEGHVHAWATITGKPTTFTPSAHTHTYAELTGTAPFAPTVHSHAWGDITGVPSFSLSTHSHDWTSITAKPTTFAPTPHTHAWTELTGVPATFTPSAHTHLWAQITDKPTTFAPAAHSHDWASITSKPTSFTPSSHTHPHSQVGIGGGSFLDDVLADSGTHTFIRNGTNSAAFMEFRDDGRVTSASIANEILSGITMVMSSSTIGRAASSSRRYKENITTADLDIDAIRSLRIAEYTYIEGYGKVGGTRDLGLIAEEVHDSGYRWPVHYDDENRPESIDYAKMSLPALALSQKNADRIDMLEAEIERLKARLAQG
jgi:hypothetical protein